MLARPERRQAAAIAAGMPAAEGWRGREAGMTATPGMEYVGQVEVAVAPPLVVGTGPLGERRIVPILGGRVAGPRLAGEILPGGADFQLIRPDGVTEIVARYTLRLDDGALV